MTRSWQTSETGPDSWLDDFELTGYESHPPIRAPIAV